MNARKPSSPGDYGGAVAEGATGFILGRLVIVVLALARRAPAWLVYGFTGVAVKLLLPLAPAVKRHIRENLAMVAGGEATPAELKRLVRENIENTFSRKWSDVVMLPRRTHTYMETHVEVVGLEKYRQAIAEGRGVLLITHHVGSYAILAGLTLPYLGNPMSGGVRRIFDKKAEAALLKVYQCHGGEAANPGDALRIFIGRLKSGGTVLMAGDHLTSPKGIRVEYFGRETLIPGGPATLACRYNPVAMPCYCVRTGPEHFRFVFGDPFVAPASGKNVEGHHLRDFARQYLSYFEEVVRRYPEQWECFFALWPKSFEKEDVEAFCRDYGVNV